MTKVTGKHIIIMLLAFALLISPFIKTSDAYAEGSTGVIDYFIMDYNGQKIVIALGGEEGYAKAYATGNDIYQYFKGSNETPTIYAILSGTKYMLMNSYAGKFAISPTTEEAMDSTDPVPPTEVNTYLAFEGFDEEGNAILTPIDSGPSQSAINLANQMEMICGYLDESDKTPIKNARDALYELSDAELDNVIAPLLTANAIAKFASEEEAKTSIRTFVRGFGEIYYLADNTALANRLDQFKVENTELFTTLFGANISADHLYDLLIAAQNQLPTVIEASEDPIKLFSKTDAELKALWPQYAKTSMRNAIDTESFSDFKGKLGAIGWSAEMLIEQQQALATLIDTNNDSELAIGKAYIRSQTLKFSGDTELVVDGSTNYNITIMGLGASAAAAKVLWDSSDTNVASFDSSLYKNKLTAKGTGTTVITAYRNVAGATPEKDWILKFEVTVSAQ